MIDIIIPAYNAYNTITNTLDSIANQVNVDMLKVYIINDGSEKSYNFIIEKYINKVDITEIYIQNSGPGAARQIGLDSSNNEFIVFIDADDTFYDETSIQKLYNAIDNSDLSEGCFIEKKEDSDKLLEPQYCYLHGKMFRRSIIKKNNICFDTEIRHSGDLYEDSSFNQLYSLCCNKIVSLKDIVYIYEYNSKSITRNNRNIPNELYNYIHSMTWLANQIEKRNISKVHDIAWNFCIIPYHCYFNYLLEPENNNFAFTDMSVIKKMYYKYINNLSFDEQLEIYKLFDYPVIPNITFYDFINKVND